MNDKAPDSIITELRDVLPDKLIKSVSTPSSHSVTAIIKIINLIENLALKEILLYIV